MNEKSHEQRLINHIKAVEQISAGMHVAVSREALKDLMKQFNAAKDVIADDCVSFSTHRALLARLNAAIAEIEGALK